MNLRECKVLDLSGDLLGSQSQVVPPGNAPNRDTRSSDARSGPADLWRSLDLDDSGHLRSTLSIDRLG